jgi:hypothetical protein
MAARSPRRTSRSVRTTSRAAPRASSRTPAARTSSARTPAARTPATRTPASRTPASRTPAARKARGAAAQRYTDPALHARIKERIHASDRGGRPGQWSARKAQLVAQEYEREGGGFVGAKDASQRHLSQWTRERWETKEGGTRARQGKTTHRYLPHAAWEQLGEEEKRATDRRKTSASRRGKQFVANTPAARQARKSASQATASVSRPRKAAAGKRSRSAAPRGTASRRAGSRRNTRR